MVPLTGTATNMLLSLERQPPVRDEGELWDSHSHSEQRPAFGLSVTGSHFNPPNTRKQWAPVHGPDRVGTAYVPSATHPLHGALPSSHPVKWDGPRFTAEETGWQQLPDLPQTSPPGSAGARIQTWVYHVWIVGDDWCKAILNRKGNTAKLNLSSLKYF